MSKELECDFEAFKRMGKELVDALPTLDQDSIVNGRKCLGLAYLNLVGTEHEQYMASIVLKLTFMETLKYET